MNKKWNWLLSFLKIGAIGFGGGTSLIPVIEDEIVNNKKLVTKEEYDKAVLVASVTPGALPVEISGSVGKEIKGIKGMLLSAICMALPGVLMTILLLICMDKINENLIKQIQIISIGITSFILYMLSKYIKGTFTWAKKQNNILKTIVIILGVFFLTAGKSISKVINHFGIDVNFFITISTIDVLAITFFWMAFIENKHKKIRIIIASILSIMYILLASKAKPFYDLINNNIVWNCCFRIVQSIMIGLAIYSIAENCMNKEKLAKKTIKHMLKEEVAWFAMLLICSVPAIFFVPRFLEYISRGFLSSIISFGGGDAYLTVADGLFVSSGIISESYFYGFLVTLVNVLPGSILCKTLTGIGYFLGYTSGGVIKGLLVALAGFACSVVGSCSVVSLVRFFFDKLEEFKAFQRLKKWIKVVISGLLGTVIFSLIYQCLNMAKAYNGNSLIILIELIFIYLLNVFLDEKLKINTWINVIISSIVALSIGNIII